MGGTWVCVRIFVICFGGGESLVLKFIFFFFFWRGWGWFYLEFLGVTGQLFKFFLLLFFFSVLWWNFINICLTFTHSFTFFLCIWGKCKCWTVCFFVFGQQQLNNCFWKVWVALRRASWCDWCRLICLFGLTLLAGLAGRS